MLLTFMGSMTFSVSNTKYHILCSELTSHYYQNVTSTCKLGRGKKHEVTDNRFQRIVYLHDMIKFGSSLL